MTLRRRSALFRVAASLGVLLCAGALSACSSSSGSNDSDSITVGLLLPFTGSSSGTASNFERAVLYAADRVNAGGGVKGHRLRVVSGDTHSDLERSKASVMQLIDAGAVMIIGPESDEIAQEIIPILNAHQVGLLSPLVGAANDAAVDCTHPWIRLAPSARALGEALAKQVSQQKIQSVGLLYAATNYDEALRDSVRSRFQTLGGSVSLELRLDPNAQSYAAQVEQARDANVDALVLTASPRAGALVVNEFDALSATPPRWFLSPLLKTDLLVQNVAPEALEGAVGVAPSIHDTSPDFPIAFGERWQGDVPLEGAYFYYDALALMALAIEKTQLDDTGAIQLPALQKGLLSAAGPPGEGVGWNDLEAGLAQLRNSENVYYSGLTGPLLLNACGERAIGLTTTWEVHAGSIQDDAESTSGN